VLGEILSEDAKSKAVVDRYLKDLETSEKAAK
jgi:F-type H+-transporting ATPase subunit b